MSEVGKPSPETIELLERRLADSVGDRVERTLKTRYGAVFAAALFVMGLSGYSIVNNLVKELVASTVGPVTKEAEKSIAQMNVQLDLARDTKRRLDGLVDQINVDADAARRRIEEFQKRLGKLQEEFEGVLAKIQDQLGSVVIRRRELEADIEGSTRGLEERLLATRDDLAILAEELRQMLARPATSDATATLEQDKRLAELVTRARTGGEGPSWSTVLLQFAGDATAPEHAQKLAQQLRANRYLVPTPRAELTDNREVRYFWPEDRALAEKTAADATTALAAIGLAGVTIAIKDFSAYTGIKPRRATVELWLALPAKAG